MDEPWYEISGPSTNDVLLEFNNIFTKHPEIVKDVVNCEESRFGGFGSWRGYWSCVNKDINHKIEEQIAEKNAYIIIQKKKLVNRFVMNYLIWPKYLEKFYKPGGRGYELVKKHYENI